MVRRDEAENKQTLGHPGLIFVRQLIKPLLQWFQCWQSFEHVLLEEQTHQT